MSCIDVVCSICLSELAISDMPIELLSCGHVFHKDCIGAWLRTSFNKCPICKQTCNLLKKKMVYLSSQPAFEPIINNIRIEFLEALQKAQKEFEEASEKRIALFEKTLVDQVEKLHARYSEERFHYKKAEKDWLDSYSKLQTVLIFLSAFIVFERLFSDSFLAWFSFFVLIEETILAKDRLIEKQKQALVLLLSK